MGYFPALKKDAKSNYGRLTIVIVGLTEVRLYQAIQFLRRHRGRVLPHRVEGSPVRDILSLIGVVPN
jgi:hypothetical protein